MTAIKAFNFAFNKAAEIEFNQNWANSTGYYDNAVSGEHAPKLEIGQVVKATSPMPNNRRILIVGTPLGNFVAFERYSGGDNGVIVYNASKNFGHSFAGMLGRPLTEQNIQWLFGHEWSDSNIGKWLNQLAADISDYNSSEVESV